jgi:hypothetical protein
VEIHFVVLVLLYAVLHEAEVSEEAVSLALRVCGQVGQVMAEATLEVSEVMRDLVGGGADNWAKEVRLVLGRGLVHFGCGRRPM